MAKRKVTKQSKRRLMIIVPLVVIAIFSCLFTVFSMGYNLYNLKQEKKSLENELVELQKNAKNLKTEITKLQDKDYVARYARENYLYTKDGEYVIKVEDDKTKIKEIKNVIKEEYVLYGAGLFTLLIILYIFMKSKKSKKKTSKRWTAPLWVHINKKTVQKFMIKYTFESVFFMASKGQK